MDGKQTIPGCSTEKFQNTREKNSKALREGKKRKADHTKKIRNQNKLQG